MEGIHSNVNHVLRRRSVEVCPLYFTAVAGGLWYRLDVISPFREAYSEA